MFSYKFKLHSKAKKDGFLGNKITCHLMLYNRIVDLGERFYKRYHKILRSKTLNKYIVMKKHDPSWAYILDGLNAWAIQNTIRRRDEAFDKFFAYLKKKKKNPNVLPKESPPQKHRIHGEGSYKLAKGHGWRLIDGGIATGQMWNNYGRAKDIHTYKFFGKRKIEGNIKNAVIKRDAYGDFWCSITTTHNAYNPLPKTGKIGGFDYSQEHFFVSDDRRHWDIPIALDEKIAEIRKAGRKFRKAKEGSNNRKRYKDKFSRLYRRMAWRREAIHYELAWKMCREYDVMCFEDNDYAEMHQKGRIVDGHRVTRKQRRRVWALAPKSFFVILKEVAKKTGKTVFFANRYYASSQICSNCDFKNPKIKNQKIRRWKCPQCGAIHDRDVNAAKNLVKEYLRTVGGMPSIETKTDMRAEGSAYWARIRKSASVKRAAGLGEESPCPRKHEQREPEKAVKAVPEHPELYTDACTVATEEVGEAGEATREDVSPEWEETG